MSFLNSIVSPDIINDLLFPNTQVIFSTIWNQSAFHSSHLSVATWTKHPEALEYVILNTQLKQNGSLDDNTMEQSVSDNLWNVQVLYLPTRSFRTEQTVRDRIPGKRPWTEVYAWDNCVLSESQIFFSACITCLIWYFKGTVNPKINIFAKTGFTNTPLIPSATNNKAWTHKPSLISFSSHWWSQCWAAWSSQRNICWWFLNTWQVFE